MGRRTRIRALRFDRDFTRLGIGRLQRASGTDDPVEFAWRNDLLSRLVEQGDLDILQALHAGAISMTEVAFAARRGRLDDVLRSAARVRHAVARAPTSMRAHPAKEPSDRATALVISDPAAAGTGDPLAVAGPVRPTEAVAALMQVAAWILTGGIGASSPGAIQQATSALTGVLAHGVGAHPHTGLPTGAEGNSRTFPGYTIPNVPDPEQSPLWDTLLTRALPLLECGDESKRRYRTSLEALRRRLRTVRRDEKLAVLSAQDPPGSPRDYPALAMAAFRALAADTAVVSDLGRIDKRFWRSLQDAWGKSPADWNHMRRALSATLSGFLQDVDHPLRRAVIRAIPLADEGPGRVPDLTPEQFWKIVEALPEVVRPAPVVLVATGMRVKEYLATTRKDLRPHIRGILVPGTKTEESKNLIYVAEEVWPWIEAGVPAPLCRKQLWTWWDRARKQVGSPDIRLHDLRHCLGQWATDAGVQEKSVQWALRHRDPNMTRRYTQSRGKREVANAMGKVLARGGNQAR